MTWMYRPFCFFLLFASLTLPGLGQSDSTQKEPGFLRRTFDRISGDSLPPGKTRYLVYPTIGYAPETSFELGLSLVSFFYAKEDYKKNRLSEVQLWTFLTLERQYGIWIEQAIYGNEDKWFFLGRIRQQRFPLLYYGIGPETSGEEPFLVDANYTLIRQRVLRKVAPNLFFGVEGDFQRLYKAEFEPALTPLPLGGDGTLNLGLGLGLVYDSRHNVLNERDATFAELAFLSYQPGWGSEYSFSAWYMDARYFRPMTLDKKQVLAAQFFGTVTNGEVPFNQLALLGGEQMMRGYYSGRYRDKTYMSAQVEYRFLPFPFSKRFGGAAFLSVGGVAPSVSDLRLNQFQPAGGIGLRYLVFPQKDIFMRLDVGFTREGPGFYFFTGESF
ncbi:MAG: BamA/TamA family outer membrane protein, partial [Bacteroidota bacterium]